MKKSILTTTAAGLAGILLISALTGCGSGTETADSGDGVQTIIVGTGTAYEPYCYLDENGNLAGYEYEVLSAVDELLPQYEFEYQTSEFKNILVALDAGQIDIAAHQYETNPERTAKYLFGEESYTTFVTYPVVLTSNTEIKTLDDLQGKTVLLSTGDNANFYVDEYNAEHTDNPILTEILDSPNYEVVAEGLRKGRWDATFRTKRDVDTINREYGNGEDFIKTLDTPLQTSSTYWVYAKENTELQQTVDAALRELKESGSLAEISIEVLGGDYTESE